MFGLLGFGHYIALVPYPVISGFMSGIGCIILILQVGPLVGFEAKPEGIYANLLAIPEFLSNPFPQATILGLLTIAIMYLTPVRMSQLIPPQLLALCAGTLGAYFFSLTHQ